MSPKDAKSVKQKSGLDLRAEAEAKFAGRVVVVEKTPREQLDEHKDTVRRGMRGFVEVGTALGLIAKQKLYKEDGYATFDEFVAAEFEVSRAWAYRAIDAARVITQMSQVETNASSIVNQAQALELAPIVKSVEAMARVVEVAKTRGPLTADLLKAVRIELFPNPKVIEGEVVPDRAEIEAPKSPVVEALTQALEEAQTAAGNLAATPEVPADGGEGTSEPPVDPSASGPSVPPPADGPDVTPGFTDRRREDAARRLRYFESGALKAVGEPSHLFGSECADVDGGTFDIGKVTCLDCLRAVVASQDSSPEASEASTGEAPARSTPSPDVPVETGSVATDLPGIDHPLPQVGEAPGNSPAAGVTPQVDDGDGVDREAVEDDSEAAPDEPSSTDPASDFMDAWREHVRLVLAVDADVVGPMLTDAEFTELYGDLELLRERVKKLQRAGREQS